MSNDDRPWDLQRVRAVVEDWIKIKQEAFAVAFVAALKLSGEDYELSTIKSAITNAKKGHEPALKQLFGTPQRRNAFAKAAGRSVRELEARLWVRPSDKPLVFAVATDHANGDVNILSRMLRTVDQRGADPRLVVDGKWRSSLRSSDQDAVEAWTAKGWIVTLEGDPAGFEAELANAYSGSPGRRAWLAGSARRTLPLWDAVRTTFRGQEPAFEPDNFHERLIEQGAVACEPRPHPTRAGDVELRKTSLAALAGDAAADPTQEPFATLPITIDEMLGDRFAALVEIARGHAPREVLERRGLKPEHLPASIRPIADSGPHLVWGENTRLALSLAAMLGEETAISTAAIDHVVTEARRAVDRAQFLQDHPGVRQVPPVAEQLVSDCGRRGIPFFVVERRRSAYYPSSSPSVFVEEVRGDRVERHLFPLTSSPSFRGVSSHLGATEQVAMDLKKRGRSPASTNPVVELARVAQVGVEAAWYSLRAALNLESVRYAPVPSSEGLAEHWERCEKAVARLNAPGERVRDPRAVLLGCLEAPLAHTVAVWPYTRMVVPAQASEHEAPFSTSMWVERHGSAALPLRRVQRDLGPSTHELFVIRAVLWLKAALRQGEMVELLEASESKRLVISDLRGLVAEVTAWTSAAGPRNLVAAVPVIPCDARGGPLILGHSFVSHQLRYADQVTYPASMWLGCEDAVVRVDFGPPDGLLDWEPVSAAEQALIAADDAAEAARAEEDDD